MKIMAKKTILVPAWSLGDLSFGVTKTYLSFIQEFGKPKMALPEDDFEPVDAVLLPGGLDVSPSSYGEYPLFTTSSTDVFKEHFFKNKLPAYIDAGIPVFGICLGMQQLNIHFGGKLCQHLAYHEQSSDRGKEAHEIYTENTTAIGYKYIGKEKDKAHFLKVNSHHHQAVLRSMLAPDLIPIAYAKNWDNPQDDIIEAFIHRTLPIAGIQYHSEEIFDVLSRILFNRILK